MLFKTRQDKTTFVSPLCFAANIRVVGVRKTQQQQQHVSPFYAQLWRFGKQHHEVLLILIKIYVYAMCKCVRMCVRVCVSYCVQTHFCKWYWQRRMLLL